MSTRTRAQHQSSSSTRRFAKPGAKPQGRRPAAAGRPRATEGTRATRAGSMPQSPLSVR